jgi:cysteine desulfurase
VDPRALTLMQPWSSERSGNPSSRDHAFGWDASEAVENVRISIGEVIGATANEIRFTSGATESINLAIKGLTQKRKLSYARIIACATEHDAVLETCRQLNRVFNIEVQFLPVDQYGRIDLQELERELAETPVLLVAVMHANNEIGTIHPIRQIAEMVHRASALLFCDITQAMGKKPVDVQREGIDLAAFSAHKIYGPKGIGALYIRGGPEEIELEPQIVGGGQERGLRGGTLNVAGAVGFGEACRIAGLEMEAEAARVKKMRDRLEEAILTQVPDTWINGDLSNRIGNTSNIGFRGVDAKTLIRDMHDIAVSTQAACSSGSTGPSHVLKAIGLTDDEAYSCIRFSLGRFTTNEEIDYAINKVVTSVHKLRRSMTVAP